MKINKFLFKIMGNCYKNMWQNLTGGNIDLKLQ